MLLRARSHNRWSGSCPRWKEKENGSQYPDCAHEKNEINVWGAIDETTSSLWGISSEFHSVNVYVDHDM